MNFKYFTATFLAIFSTVFSALAQIPADVPANYFLFPVKPGEQNFLSGTMGEIRPSHFHGGIDIKTGAEIGWPIYAAADGYVSRYKASTYGYGNVVYLTHPNGLVTVYGHLDRFAEPIAGYMLRKQYELQTYELELKPEKDIFKFKKGDIIGYGGNTGGSGGPHLHFEVRDENHVLYNPLRFKFVEIQDHIAPELLKVALNTFSIDARVNNQFGLQEFTPIKTGKTLTLKDTIFAHGVIGLEMQAFDRLDKADNKNGVQQVDLTVNGKPVYSHYKDGIPIEKSRQISCHINYEQLKRYGKTFEKCYVDDGNHLPIYSQLSNSGKFLIKANSVNELVLTLKDSYQNTTTLKFTIIGRKPAFAGEPKKPKKPQLNYEVLENILKVTANDTAAPARNLDIYVGRMKYNLLPSYATESGTVHLYDLRGGIPDSIRMGTVSRKLGITQAIPVNQEISYTDKNVSLIFQPNTLFDTLYIQTGQEGEFYSVNDLFTPLYEPMKLTIKPATLPPDLSKASIYYAGWGKSRGFEGGKWENGAISTYTKNLGKFRILSDSTPPSVKLVMKNKDVISFKVTDDLSGLASYHLEIDGKFVLLRYEHKKALLWSEKLDKNLPLSGEAVLKVKDMMGNETVYKTKI